MGVVEAKREEAGEHITDVEVQSNRYVNSKFKWVKGDYSIRFVYEATDKIIRFTDYKDIKYRSRTVFSFHRPETLQALQNEPDTIRNNMKHFPPLVPTVPKMPDQRNQQSGQVLCGQPSKGTGTDGNGRRQDLYCNSLRHTVC